MPYLHHTWFDPTSLMSRSVQWSTLPEDPYQKRVPIEILRVALEKDVLPEKYAKPRKRGRQRRENQPSLCRWNPDIVNHIGVVGNEDDKHALYYIHIGNITLGLVGIHIWKENDQIHAEVPLIFVVPEWRKKGLGTSIAGHAGLWLATAKHHWNRDVDWNMHLDSHNTISAKLLTHTHAQTKEGCDLFNVNYPKLHWTIHS